MENGWGAASSGDGSMTWRLGKTRTRRESGFTLPGENSAMISELGC